MGVSMGFILKPGKVVVILSGRFAGKKGFVVSTFADSQPFGRALILGLATVSGEKKRRNGQLQKEMAKKWRVKTFFKIMNAQHLMPTRYAMASAPHIASTIFENIVW